MACLETYATLRIFSDKISPESINEKLKVNATDSFSKDINSRYRPRRETNFWGWSTRGQLNSTDNIQHLLKVIELVKSHKKQFQELRKSGCQIDVTNYWLSTGQGGPYLNISIMKELVSLELNVWWDIYFDTKENGTDPKEIRDSAQLIERQDIDSP